jgi:regulator of replication initiation timing
MPKLTETVGAVFEALNKEIEALKKENKRLNIENRNLKNRLSKAHRTINRNDQDNYDRVEFD